MPELPEVELVASIPSSARVSTSKKKPSLKTRSSGRTRAFPAQPKFKTPSSDEAVTSADLYTSAKERFLAIRLHSPITQELSGKCKIDSRKY